VADEGWRRLPDVAPELARLVRPLHEDPGPLVDALATTPRTFLHGDWKMGNLGWHPDGRTILLDWAYPGAGPACWDLMWYLALNRARLPRSKEQSIERYRAALEAHGVDTTAWWDRQLGLAFLAIMVVFGWEKAVGDADEMSWWQDRAVDGARWLT
jgi:thiamine kinase-like enzyme